MRPEKDVQEKYKIKWAFLFMKKLFVAILFVILFSMSGFTSSILKEKASGRWFLSPQVYDMVALPPEDVKTFHITVNGLWNGFFAANLTSPFAFGRYIESLYSGRNYESDEDFVKAMHDEGLLVPATILTTQGHRSKYTML